MVTFVLALYLAAAFGFERGADGAWRLLRDGKTVDELSWSEVTFIASPGMFDPAKALGSTEKFALMPRRPVVVVNLPGNWRWPVREVRRMTASDTQKQLYIAFLKKTYAYQIAALNQAYGLDATAFTEVESSDFATLDENRPRVVADDIAFAAEFYGERLQAVFGSLQTDMRVAAISKGAPAELIRVLGALPKVDAILLRDLDPQPVDGLAKPLLMSTCPAVKPVHIAACTRI